MNLDAIKARCAALRHDKGSWHADDYCGIVWGGPDTINDGRICDIRGWGHLTGGGALGLTSEEAAATQDARKAFIAHARTDVPALVSEVERLRAALSPIIDVVRQIATCWGGDVSLAPSIIMAWYGEAVSRREEASELRNDNRRLRTALAEERKACDAWLRDCFKESVRHPGVMEVTEVGVIHAAHIHRARRAAEQGKPLGLTVVASDSVPAGTILAVDQDNRIVGAITSVGSAEAKGPTT